MRLALKVHMNRPKLAIVGCGLQTEMNHLPAIAGTDADIILLVDKVVPSARRLAEQYSISAAAADYREVIGQADAALVALPNHLHAPVAIDLLRNGVHVLVEKPMALNTKQCDEMIDAANYGNAILAVGLDFRFPKTAQFTYHVLKQGLVGDLLRFDLRIGNDLTIFSFRSDYLLRRDTAGGGVLIDLAVHGLDLVLWWLGDYESVDYYDDAMGGVEANSELHLRLRSGVSGIIEASRTRALRNTCIIEGTRGTLEVGFWDKLGLLKLNIPKQPITLVGADSEVNERWREVFRRQFNDFAAAVRDRREPFVPGREGRRSIQLIEDCYSSRQPLSQPWSSPVAKTGTNRERVNFCGA